MRVLVAPDSFGGTLSAVEAAEAVARGWRSTSPDDELVLLPLSDGGPGFVDVLAHASGAELQTVHAGDPLGRPVPATVAVDGTTAVVETAAACGLHLLGEDERDPRRTSTAGVADLVRAALDAGARELVLGLGGSGTNDGGAGLLGGLGLALRDEAGEPLPPGGAALRRLASVDGEVDERLQGVRLLAATDVDSPLLGPAGASAVFGPQKGADAATVPVLDAALERLAEVLERDRGVDRALRDAPGAGAAGGLGHALLALGAERVSGVGLVLDRVGLAARVADADLVLTGEGRYDWSSLRGKVVSGVARVAQEAAVPCVVLAGEVLVGRRESAASGVEATYSLADLAGGAEQARARPAEHLAALAARVARSWAT